MHLNHKEHMNPLGENYSEDRNIELVRTSLKGDKHALNELIRLHRPYIYNVAWKFTFDPMDAEDLTQEALIKVITKLSQFKYESQFRTWLYRIVFNEFLQSKRRRGEKQFTNFEDQAERLDSIENTVVSEQEERDLEEKIKELRYRCLSGMIMCLTREQRLLFIVGETFGVDHNIGAEIFDLSKQNYRIKLHRARKDIINFMQDKCGLMNPKNPCRCAKKTKTMHQRGYLTDDKHMFNVGYRKKVADYVEENLDLVADIVDHKHLQLLRDVPAKDNFDSTTVLDEILGDKELLDFFELN